MRKNGSESGMWAQVVDIVLGTWDNLTRADGIVDVAGFAVIVPCGGVCKRIRSAMKGRDASRHHMGGSWKHLHVMIWTNSGRSSSMCIHRSYQSLSLADSQFFSHWGNPDE
jgi:hypothetical protein